MIDLDTPPKHLWPRSLKRIADWCGDQVALDLWLTYPGVHVHIPNTVNSEHPLVKAVGLDGALALCKRCGGENLLIAKAYKARLVLRNFVIRRLRRNGESHRALALKYDLSERQVVTICNAEIIVPVYNQVDLFADNE
jgi:hypothetical protein